LKFENKVFVRLGEAMSFRAHKQFENNVHYANSAIFFRQTQASERLA